MLGDKLGWQSEARMDVLTSSQMRTTSSGSNTELQDGDGDSVGGGCFPGAAAASGGTAGDARRSSGCKVFPTPL